MSHPTLTPTELCLNLPIKHIDCVCACLNKLQSTEKKIKRFSSKHEWVTD